MTEQQKAEYIKLYNQLIDILKDITKTLDDFDTLFRKLEEQFTLEGKMINESGLKEQRNKLIAISNEIENKLLKTVVKKL